MADNNKQKKQANKSTKGKKVSYPYPKNSTKGSTTKKAVSSGTKTSNSTKGNGTKVNKSTSTNKVKKSKKKRSIGFRIFKWIFVSLFLLGLTLCVIGLGYFFAIIKSAPPLDVQAIKSLSEPTSFYDNNGEFMDNLNSEINRNIIDFQEMPQTLRDAFLAIEDQRFYEHTGIDIIRIGGSIITDVKKIIKGDTGFHGGSTITQQLLKNTILTNEESKIERKIKEIWLAINLEKELSKDEILHLYLNTIPMGGTAYGVDAAANLYFGKSASELNLIESAFLAGINQAPTYYSPYNIANENTPEVYLNRTKTVLNKMLELKKITKEEYNKGISDIDNGGLAFHSTTNSYELEYESYINPTIKQVKEDLIEKYKYTSEEVSKLLANGGLKIYTNMDRSLQDHAQQVLNDYKINNGEELIEGTNTPAFQGSATIVDYRTGAVKALIGGRGNQGAQSINRAYDELRSVGSSTKPLTVYGPAINEKVFTAASTIDDAPLPDSISKLYPGDDGGNYNPKNDNKKYAGNVTLREGIKESKNVVAVLVEHNLGLETGKAYGEKLGLKYNSTYTGIAALALGQFQNDPANPDGGNTYSLASAFGVFGNEGKYTKPYLYYKVEDSNGNVLLSSQVEETEIFSKETAFIMYDLLKGSRSYTGPYAQWGAMPVAGKTGTTSYNKDLWFSGLTPYYSGSVWLGYYNSSKSMDNYGVFSSAASEVWGKIMEKAHEGLEVKDITQPDSIQTSTVCKDSGKLATSLCKSDSRGNRVYTEYFVKGTVPTSYCDAHVMAEINTSNNKLATDNTPKNLIAQRVFVKKPYVNSVTADYPYTLPHEVDDTIPTKEKEESNSNKDKDKNKNNNSSNSNTNNNADDENEEDENIDTENETRR